MALRTSGRPPPPAPPIRWLPARQVAVHRALARAWRLPPERNRVACQPDVEVPVRDGVALLTDHFGPAASGTVRHPTILIRTPYGRQRGSATLAVPLAARGYHVLVQSCRGTFGSGGTWMPMAHETTDGVDTVGWLRGEPWFDGRLATFGASYAGYVQWALASAAPPELRAMSMQFPTHSGTLTAIGRGPLSLLSLLVWSDLLADQERLSPLRSAWRMNRVERRHAAAFEALPLTEIPAGLTGIGAPWWTGWVEHPDAADEYWEQADQTAALHTATVPTMLLGGWQDIFGEQLFEQYRALAVRGVPVRLRVGPWTHLDAARPVAQMLTETLWWLDRHLSGTSSDTGSDTGSDTSSGAPPGPLGDDAVQAFFTGLRQWRGYRSWPPATRARRLALSWQGVLADPDEALPRSPDAEPGVPGGDGAVMISYDPADPTPSVGGATLARSAGVRDNTALEARRDVVTFSTGRLREAVTIAGRIAVRLRVRTEHPYADVFVRICDVDEHQVSRNLTDQLIRLDPADWTSAGADHLVELLLPDVAHAFLAGHRIRLQLSGGAFPRFARNLGTGEPPATATTMRPTTIAVLPSGSSVSLPVLDEARSRSKGG